MIKKLTLSIYWTVTSTTLACNVLQLWPYLGLQKKMRVFGRNWKLSPEIKYSKEKHLNLIKMKLMWKKNRRCDENLRCYLYKIPQIPLGLWWKLRRAQPYQLRTPFLYGPLAHGIDVGSATWDHYATDLDTLSPLTARIPFNYRASC